jgi:transketolase
LGGKLDGRDYHVYCMVGDGEMNEGQNWEAMLFAAHQGLDNLICIVDSNRVQLDGYTKDILDTEPLPAKFEAFGWHTLEIDGHDMDAVFAALQEAIDHQGAPVAIIARTVKGKGISFMENEVEWHGVAPDEDQATKALAELAQAAGEV